MPMVVPGSPLHSALAAELAAPPVYGAAVRGGASALAACAQPTGPGAQRSPDAPPHDPPSARPPALDPNGSLRNGMYGSSAFNRMPSAAGLSPIGSPAALAGSLGAAADDSARDGGGFPDGVPRDMSTGRPGGSERGGNLFRPGSAMSASALGGALALVNASTHGGSLAGSMLGDASASLRAPASPMESVHGGGQQCLAAGEGSPIRRLILDSANLNDGAACPALGGLLPTPGSFSAPTGSLLESPYRQWNFHELMTPA